MMIRLIVLSMLLFPSLGHATVFWDEDWEESDTVVSANWGGGGSCGDISIWPRNNNPNRSATRAFSGANSLKHVFSGHSGVDPGAGGCFIDRYHPAVTEAWWRWYEYFEPGFIVDADAGTKTIKPGSNNASHWWVYKFGSRQMAFEAQAVWDSDIVEPNKPKWDTTQYNHNVAPFNQPDGQWVCYEWHIRYNTPGQADGLLEGWANGQQIMSYPGRRWRGDRTTDPTPSNADFTLVREYVQHGVGILYRDKLAVGTTRIGCSGSPAPPDTIPPGRPIGLTAR